MPSTKTGKDFEAMFKELSEAEGVQVIRLHDVTNGYKGIDNPADFIISKGKESPSILIETKVCQKTSFGLDFRQRDRLSSLDNFRSFVVIWFTEYKRIIAISIDHINYLFDIGYKSISPSRIDGVIFPIDLLDNSVSPIDLCSSFKRVNPSRLEVLKLWPTEN